LDRTRAFLINCELVSNAIDLSRLQPDATLVKAQISLKNGMYLISDY
jgi:hypothetical protein